MKIPYTFVLLSSCVMISSAMAMIDPSKVADEATTSTTTLPLVHAPATDTATGADNPDTPLNTAPPAFDPRAIADDDANDASRQATVEDADEDSSTGSYDDSSNSDDDADDKSAAPAASTSSTSTSTTAAPGLTFTKVQTQMSLDGAFTISEQGTADDRFQRVQKKPSQLFNLQTERQLFAEYWQALQKTVGDFVNANKDDKASFFVLPMISLQESMKGIDGDVNHLLTCGDRIFDDLSKLKNVAEVVISLKEFLKKADYHIWMGKKSKSKTVYPWMKDYPKIGLKDEDKDEGDNNIFKHLEKMTAADRTLHSQLPFIQFFGNITDTWLKQSVELNKLLRHSYAFAGENKWERPEADPRRAGLLEMLRLLGGDSDDTDVMRAMMSVDPAAAFGGGRNPFASLGGRSGMPNVAAMRAGSENRDDDNGNQSDSDGEAAPTATGNAETGASNSAPRGTQCAQQ